MDKTTVAPSLRPVSLKHIQDLIGAQGLAALLIRSTDRYFNEYVPKELSIRAKLTGFDGSIGDAIVTKSDAHLFVDGRYRLQARAEAKGFTIHVCDNAHTIETTWLNKLEDLLKAREVLAYDPHTIDMSLFDKLSQQITKIDAKLDPNATKIFSQLLDGPLQLLPKEKIQINQIDPEISGFLSSEKLAVVTNTLAENGLDGFLTVKLDDIAWLSNLRSYFFPYQSSVPGIACILKNKLIFGLAYENHSTKDITFPSIEIVRENEFFEAIKKKSATIAPVLGVDANETSKAHELALRDINIDIRRIENPISSLKAIKNEKELLHMRSAFKKADFVVHNTHNFVIESFEAGRELSESDVDDYVKKEFKQSGAKDLSFRPICASGKNGAIIHYGTPDRKQILEEGSLFLLDTGAYYEGGYATDLTRTFLAGKRISKAKSWQKEMFTLVLKASISGLSARIRRGTLGLQLDAIVRSPLWQAGLDYAHGTGHGVGINVHEFPPRIGPLSSTVLLEGHVFSIEPGLYFEGLGGVRIENLATLVVDKENPYFLRVLPLTFSPLDERLIEDKMLDFREMLFLDYYRKEWDNNALWPNLPPLTKANFSL